MSFNILFYGLVCHRRNEDTSVFVGAHGHQLRMIVRQRDVISKTGFKIDPEETHFALDTNEPQTSFDVQGRVLNVEGTVPVRSSFTPQFLEYVPLLRGGDEERFSPHENPAVSARTITELLTAYLSHDGGAFSVNDFFPEKCTLTGDVRDAKCIARTTRLTMDAYNNVAITDDQGGRVVLRPDAEVRFVNTIPPPVGGTMTNRHFPDYYNALFNGFQGRVPMEAQIKCGHRHDPSFAVGGGDCSNSGDP